MSGQASRHSLKIRLACYNAAGVDISTGTDPGVTVAQHILHLRSPNAKSLCTAVLTEPLKGPAVTRADFDPDGAVMLS
jgi:hypothetical protein